MSQPKTTLNPLAYSIPEVAKALIAILGGLITLAGILVANFSNGPLHDVGYWASIVAAVALTPAFVFMQKAEKVIDVVDPEADSGS